MLIILINVKPEYKNEYYFNGLINQDKRELFHATQIESNFAIKYH